MHQTDDCTEYARQSRVKEMACPAEEGRGHHISTQVSPVCISDLSDTPVLAHNTPFISTIPLRLVAMGMPGAASHRVSARAEWCARTAPEPTPTDKNQGQEVKKDFPSPLTPHLLIQAERHRERQDEDVAVSRTHPAQLSENSRVVTFTRPWTPHALRELRPGLRRRGAALAPVEIGLLLVEEVEEGGECTDRERRGKVGCELEEKERFWSELDEVMESIPTGERVVIGADFNGHVGEGNTGDEEVMGKFGVKERNLEGQMVVDFAKRMDMGVVNTYFQKREEHRVTYKSGGRRTQVDYILCRRGNLKEISDCKVVVGESVARQHRMVVCRMTLMVCKKKRSEIEKKTKWWKLKKEECCEEFRQKLRQALGGQVVLPDDWETTAEVIRETGRKVLGVSSGRRKEDKETWWWNEEVQDSVQRKRLAKKKWDMDRTEENRQEYKELQRRVKREVSKAKQKAYDELYTRLDTREGEKDLYRLARQRDRDGKDVQQVRVIKDRDGRVLTSEESVQRRWKEYFEELMNEENEREKRVEGVNSVEQKVDKIRKDEVRKALKRMKSGKAVGPDDIPVEVWKCFGRGSSGIFS
ncbi:hypothetical protein QTP86_023796 [Hemibagrus guttatus]|nr:hypothetical protein QTP86_023796 [Hemibagrus guttatus]